MYFPSGATGGQCRCKNKARGSAVESTRVLFFSPSDSKRGPDRRLRSPQVRWDGREDVYSHASHDGRECQTCTSPNVYSIYNFPTRESWLPVVSSNRKKKDTFYWELVDFKLILRPHWRKEGGRGKKCSLVPMVWLRQGQDKTGLFFLSIFVI